jgi:hypothetical protein
MKDRDVMRNSVVAMACDGAVRTMITNLYKKETFLSCARQVSGKDEVSRRDSFLSCERCVVSAT